MKILGLHTIYHDTGACLLDGQRVVAVAEERVNREKHSGKFPSLSIDYCLKEFGLTDINQVDYVAVDHLKDKRADIERELREFGYRGEIFFVDHHDAHAASAFFCSPFEDAAILVIDGEGSSAEAASSDRPASYLAGAFDKSRELQSFYRGTNSAMKLIKRTMSTDTHRHGIGNFYSAISRFLNFGEFGAGKVMGLAPYGGKKPESSRLLWENHNGDIVFNTDIKFRGDRNLAKFSKKFLGGVRARAEQTLPDDLYTELAWLCQYNCERGLVTIANWLWEVTRAKNICISGGVGLNSVSNQKIIDETPFEDIFVQPACSDTGIAFGCAMYVWHEVLGKPRFHRMDNAYLGREYKDEEIKEALRAREAEIVVEKRADIEAATAKLLADGNIVAWHQGGSEAGPRALGHRSILSDPRPVDARDRMNIRVKHREWWRPFAPSVLAERATEFFKLKTASPYMLLIAEVLEEKRDQVRAITHVDGTARVQTVTEKDNGRYYRMIKEFYKLTNVPLVLNTSFNDAGEPIVESPADSLNCFLKTDIDALIIDDYLIRKRKADAF